MGIPNSARPRPRPEPEDGARLDTEIIDHDARGLAQALGVSARHIAALHAQGRLPAPIRLGRRVVWVRAEIEDWLAAGAPARDRWEVMREVREVRR